MSYLKDFLTQIGQKNFHKFLVLWEEYCSSDAIEAEEFSQLLRAIKGSDFATPFGQIVETAIPLWQTITNPEESYAILRLLIDLQTTNSPALAELASEALHQRYGSDPKFQERLRIIGFRSKNQFQGVLSRYDLLAHMAKNHMVFHTGGWGTGEMMDVSFVREHLAIEFENIAGRKDFSFTNAFKTLIPLPSSHFLARRFANPDQLEEEGRKDPVALIKLLLHDMGPKTASEIKDELCDLVIPSKDWTKWWQAARTKIKKDPMIETPDSLKEPFLLRKAEISPEERLHHTIQNKAETGHIIQTTYAFLRDTPGALKNPQTKQSIQDKLLKELENSQLTEDQQLQISLLLEQFFGYQPASEHITRIIQHHTHLDEIVHAIEIVALKKRVLLGIKKYRSDWADYFLRLLFSLPQAQLRDYLLRELNQKDDRPLLEKKLKDLMDHPHRHPETFIWYFQKLMGKEEDLPFQTEDGKRLFFEVFFLLLHAIENQAEHRSLLKKMYFLLTTKRYELVRDLLRGSSIEFTREFLLLASKCQTLSDHDLKILRSLAEVVHPSLAQPKQRKGAQTNEEEEELWTTEEGFLKVQARLQHISTVEIIENAREIEAARALGDLRENSEFKFAQEKRVLLQSEQKKLSEELKRARVIQPMDVPTHEVGIGSVVDVINSQGKRIRYTLLGRWDAEPEKNILYINSKLAQAMVGKKMAERFNFRDESFQIEGIGSYFKQLE